MVYGGPRLMLPVPEKSMLNLFFSKPLKIFSCYVSTIHGGASSRGMDEQYHICEVVSFFLSLGGHKDGFYQLRETQQKFMTFLFLFSPSIV